MKEPAPAKETTTHPEERPPRRLRKGWRIFCWLVLFLFVSEIGVRFAGYLLRRDGVADTSINTAGGTIYCLGDSFTYGQGVRREEAWPVRLSERLHARYKEKAPRIQIHAHPGRSSSSVVAEVGSLLKRHDARLILIMTGWNANDGDFASLAARRNQVLSIGARLDLLMDYSALYRLVKHLATLRNRTLLLDEVKLVPQTNSMKLYNFADYQEVARQNLMMIARMCKSASVPCIFLTYPHRLLPPNPFSRTEYYHVVFGRSPINESDFLIPDKRANEIAINSIIRHVAEHEGIPIIDLQPFFESRNSDGLFLGDWHHPTASGHDLIAEAIVRSLSVQLERTSTTGNNSSDGPP